MTKSLVVFAVLALVLVPLLAQMQALAQVTHSATLTWAWAQGTGDAATGFRVLRSSVSGGPYTSIATTAVTTLTYTDLNVKAGDKWFYVVTAFNTAGDSAPSAEVSALIPFQIPQAPTGTAVTVQ